MTLRETRHALIDWLAWVLDGEPLTTPEERRAHAWEEHEVEFGPDDVDLMLRLMALFGRTPTEEEWREYAPARLAPFYDGLIGEARKQADLYVA